VTVLPFTHTVSGEPATILIRLEHVIFCPMPTQSPDAPDQPWRDMIAFAGGTQATLTAPLSQWRMLADAFLATCG